MRRGRDVCVGALCCAAVVGTAACGGRVNLGGVSDDATLEAGRGSAGRSGASWAGNFTIGGGGSSAGGGLYAIGGAYSALQPCEPGFQSASWIAFDSDREDYDRELYKARHLIENFFAKLKQFRAIATRCDKTAQNFLAAIHLAATAIWLN